LSYQVVLGRKTRVWVRYTRNYWAPDIYSGNSSLEIK